MHDHDTAAAAIGTAHEASDYDAGDYTVGEQVQAMTGHEPAGSITHLLHPGPAAWTVIECWWNAATDPPQLDAPRSDEGRCGDE